MVLHLHAKGRCRFPGKADDGIAVGAVVGDFKIHNGIIVSDDQIDIVAHLAILVIEDPDAVGISLGKIVLSQTQFGIGAEHTIGFFATELALGDVNTAGEIRVVQRSGNQVALMDVLGTGDNLDGFLFAHINLADPHMIGIFMADNGQNLANLYILDFAVHSLPGFYLLAEDSELLHILFIRDIGQIDKLLMEPFSV